MNELKNLVQNIFTEEVIKININGAIYKSNEDKKIIVTEKKGKNNNFYQIEIFYGEKVRHINIEDKKEVINCIMEFLEKGYKQMDIITTTNEHKFIMNKKGNFKVKSKEEIKEKVVKSHNKEKEYILKEGDDIPFLVELGIMSKNGKIIESRQKKFKQINKFLEEFRAIEKKLPENPTIVDVGCGKSYLTYAVYHYMTYILKKPCNIIGIDLKTDVIEYCNNLKEKMYYSDMKFYNVDIKDFKDKYDVSVDMVISLHACNTATDYAIYSGINWGANIIMSVPCCHKELYGQVQNDLLNPMLKHGILKERFQSMLCDTIRGLCLESKGYDVRISEFIEMEHTPKNIMILGIYTDTESKKREEALNQYKKIEEQFSINQTLYNLIYNN